MDQEVREFLEQLAGMISHEFARINGRFDGIEARFDQIDARLTASNPGSTALKRVSKATIVDWII